jgi:hypothetical protein
MSGHFYSEALRRQGRAERGVRLAFRGLSWLSLILLVAYGGPTLAQSQPSPARQDVERAAGTMMASAGNEQPANPPVVGTITGTVVDGTGTAVCGAVVKVFREGRPLGQEVSSDEDGHFVFAGVAPGPFQVTTTMEGFAMQRYSGTLHSGETFSVPAIALVVASATTEVQVSMTRMEFAEAEIKDEEKQRILGVVPNFYVTYDPDAAPLTTKQKFELAWKSSVDPINFGITAGTAGVEQATDSFNGYGQGAAGYARRYGASYAGLVSSTFIGSAMLPSVLKQDPRYFYKGRGSVGSRILYALANSVICKGDNGHWQANYSGIAGGLASGAISNLYYPGTDRSAAVLTAENTLIGIGSTAATNLLQEFVIRKLTPHAPSYGQTRP